MQEEKFHDIPHLVSTFEELLQLRQDHVVEDLFLLRLWRVDLVEGEPVEETSAAVHRVLVRNAVLRSVEGDLDQKENDF